MTFFETRTWDLAFLHEQALEKTRGQSEQERASIEAARRALDEADEILVSLGGKAGRLGECVVGTGLLEGLLLALRYVGKKGTPVQILVEGAAVDLLEQQLYQEHYWPQITVGAVQPQESDETLKQRARGRAVLIVDLHGAHDSMPTMSRERSEARTITTLGHLFRVGVRSYARRGPVRRYGDCIEELFGLPPGAIDGRQAQPTIRLSAADEARYPDLARAYGLSGEALPVICFFQSVVPAKCYCRWDEVLTLLCEHFARHSPERKLDFLLACGPDETVPDGIRKADLEEDFRGFAGVGQNARVLVRFTPSLRDLSILTSRAAFVLSNDTGPGHIAGALHVPTIVPYLPGNIYSRQVWASTLWHHGVTLDPNPYSFRQIEAAILWDKTDIIDSVPPTDLYAEILKHLPGGIVK